MIALTLAACDSGGEPVCQPRASQVCQGEDLWWADSCGSLEELANPCPFGCQAGSCLACQPDCAGLECGPDGCGGSCGACQAGAACSAGACACLPRASQACQGTELWWFDSCGLPQELGQVCPSGCQDGACLGCQPDCAGAECGPDSCGGSCGSCQAGAACSAGACACLPHASQACQGAELWWFDSCGLPQELGQVCPSGCQDGACLGCQPDCAGAECGPDSCGGSCGSCQAGAACSAGACACLPHASQACQGAELWWFDSCGLSQELAQACANGCQDGACLGCQPDCAGLACGPDGCGGSCGACQAGATCSAGACACLPHASQACQGAELWWFDSCGLAQELAQVCANGCLDGACLGCQPDCAGAECGPDGCGGTCGACQAGATCSAGACACLPHASQACQGADVWWFDSCGLAQELAQVCANGCLDGVCVTCQPSCAGLECGPDGCGGSCGSCGAGLICSAGLCAPDGVTGLAFAPARQAELAGSDPEEMAVADLDHDGDLDLVVAMQGVASGDGKLAVLLGDGLGGFTDLPISVAFQPVAVALCDLDGDGHLDLTALDAGLNGPRARHYLGDGLGGFSPAGATLTATTPRALACGLLDGDGIPDLVVGAAQGVVVHLGHGSAHFADAASVAAAAGLDVQGLRLHDLDGDADLDLALPQAVLLGDGLGGFGQAVGLGGTRAVAVGDVNGDAVPDVVVAAGARLIAWQGNGAGGFSAWSVLELDDEVLALAAADLDRDGRADLAVSPRLGDQELVVLAGAAGLLAPLHFAVGLEPRAVAAADLNQDGLIDLAVGWRNAGQTPWAAILLQSPPP